MRYSNPPKDRTVKSYWNFVFYTIYNYVYIYIQIIHTYRHIYIYWFMRQIVIFVITCSKTQQNAWVSQLTGLREESLKVKLRHCISLLALADRPVIDHGFYGDEAHGSLNVPMFHITQPWSVYGLLDGYYKVMSNIPKMGQLPTPGSMVNNWKSLW